MDATPGMPAPTDPAALDIERLLCALASHGVEYVLTGSVAMMAYGVVHRPGDLDLAPALDPANLRRVAGLLGALGAKPQHVPTWRRGLSREACVRWVPDPATEEQLDHRFVTPCGELDVVPRLSGTYHQLAARAAPATAFGIAIRVAHPDDLIAQCERWARETDRLRLPLLVAARDRFLSEGLPADIGARLG